MKAMLLVYAGLVAGGSGINPAIWNQTEQYTVTARVVKIDAQGNRRYVTIPKINVTPGQDYRVRCDCNERGEVKVARVVYPVPPWENAFEESSFERGNTPRRNSRTRPNVIDWKIVVATPKNRHPRIKIAYTGDATVNGEDSGRYQVDEHVPFGETRRVVLTRDSEGRPTSWMEVSVNRQRNATTTFPDARTIEKEPIEGVFPFYYEAF